MTMKTLIVYYSFSGITERVVNMYAKELAKTGEITVQRLKPKAEITTFFGQCNAAFMRKRAELEGTPAFDVTGYDLIMIGSPVWAFTPTPAVNTYLDKLSGIAGKKTIILLTSGSGTGVGNCFSMIKKALETKKAAKIDTINIPNRMMSDESFIVGALKKVL
jgi:flavodoxin